MKLRVGAPFVAITVLMSVVQANSSGCVPNSPVQKVTFPPGKRCWYFQGIGTIFEVQLTSGQSAYVHMRGVEGEVSPEVHGPNQFYKFQDPLKPSTDELEFQAPTTGSYDVTLAPCGAWGEEIKVEICAK